MRKTKTKSGAKTAVGAGKAILQNNPENSKTRDDLARIHCQLAHRCILTTRPNRDVYHLFRYVNE